MKPSRILTIYYLASFAIGTVLTIPVAFWVEHQEIGARGAAIMALCWNVLFSMILPLVLDWCEAKHCKVRFLDLEEVARENPELATAISEQCKMLDLPHLRLAIADTAADETFSYGLWGYNPRLILPAKLLRSREKSVIIPSIEAELTRFTSQDNTLMFLLFTVVQIILQQVIVAII